MDENVKLRPMSGDMWQTVMHSKKSIYMLNMGLGVIVADKLNSLKISCFKTLSYKQRYKIRHLFSQSYP